MIKVGAADHQVKTPELFRLLFHRLLLRFLRVFVFFHPHECCPQLHQPRILVCVLCPPLSILRAPSVPTSPLHKRTCSLQQFSVCLRLKILLLRQLPAWLATFHHLRGLRHQIACHSKSKNATALNSNIQNFLEYNKPLRGILCRLLHPFVRISKGNNRCILSPNGH